MRFAAAVLSVLSLSACSNHPTAAEVLIGGMILYQAVDYSRDPRPMPALSDIYDPRSTFNAPPPMAADRKITEVDCSKPVDLSAGNLKCR